VDDSAQTALSYNTAAPLINFPQHLIQVAVLKPVLQHPTIVCYCSILLIVFQNRPFWVPEKYNFSQKKNYFIPFFFGANGRQSSYIISAVMITKLALRVETASQLQVCACTSMHTEQYSKHTKLYKIYFQILVIHPYTYLLNTVSI